MKKNNFIKIIGSIQKQAEYCDEVYQKLHIDLYNSPLFTGLSETLNILQDELDDKDDWIGYWMWELDFGKKWKPGTITDSEGIDYKLETVDDLWNILTEKK